MPVPCTETGFPSHVPRVAEHPALAVHLGHVLEVRLGDVLRAQRVAGEEDGFGVVAGLGSEVDRHGATLSAPDVELSGLRPTVTPTLDQVLAFCAEEPVERVFLEDIARRGLGRFSARRRRRRAARGACHVGANVVPSGRGCAAFAEAAARSGARMVIGEERAVGELWDAARRRMPRPRDDRPGQPVYALREAARARRDGPARGDARTISSCSSLPARRPTARRSGSTRSSATPTASAGGRGSRSRRAARGSGSRTA